MLWRHNIIAAMLIVYISTEEPEWQKHFRQANSENCGLPLGNKFDLEVAKAGDKN